MLKLLIANRGEIAVRIIRAAREMGIRTVAVYSDADKDSVHSGMADEAVYLGGSAPSESYLAVDKVIAAAKETRADAIHPGYGFLSERPELSEACATTGVLFVGPSAHAMRLLGSKSSAKTLAAKEGVPIVPGLFTEGATPSELSRAAEEIGYPVLLKASAGGGGRGMREVRDPSTFADDLSIAVDEALKAFGDGSMMVEKLVDRPRHVEVQILADGFGNVACLFERECSLQRRHQKLVEESPSPYLVTNLPMWEEMQKAARQLALASGYVGAGTVEFMVDEPAGKFYFLEVNTRLQVEHPVTEAITGLDLVKWQLRIASGETLSLDADLMSGERRAIVGHSIEARVVAEDPAAGFMPSTGKIVAWAEPKAPGIRVDTGFGPGAEVSRFYDSLIAKVIAHGETRLEAITRLRSALLDFHILGASTNIGYLIDVLSHPDFIVGRIDTGFLSREFHDWRPIGIPPELGSIAGCANAGERPQSSASEADRVWSGSDGFRNARSAFQDTSATA